MNPSESSPARCLTYPHSPLFESLFPVRSLARDVLLVLGGSLAVALSAQVSIPLQPVPITLQTLGVLLVGATLGSRLGFLALLVYLAKGFVLPVFAGGGTWFDPRVLFTGGYLVSFPLAAFAAGWLVERFGTDRSVGKTFVAMLLSGLVIYVVGVLWLGFALSGAGQFRGLWDLLQVGMLRFLLGDVVEAAIAAVLLPCARRWVGR